MMELIKLLGLSGLILAAVAWLAREVVRESLRREADRLIEAVRRDNAVALEQVRRDAQVEVERQKHTLAIDMERYKIRFAGLQSKRLELLSKLYSLIVDFLQASSFLKIHVGAASQITDELKGEVVKTYSVLDELLTEYRSAMLYLPKEVSDEIWQLISPADVGLRRAKACVEQPNQIIGPLKGCLETISLSSSVSEVLPSFHALLGVEGRSGRFGDDGQTP